MNELSLLKEGFEKSFNSKIDKIYFSPGRVNLIGEHIDYNGGKVLPMAISLGIYGAVSYRNDNLVRAISNGFNVSPIVFKLDELEKEDDFTDYIKGVIKEISIFSNKEFNRGFDLYLLSNLPPASGLSSSACLELLTSHIINDMYDLGISDLDLVLLSQKAEREFVKVNCGIMDQFAIGMANIDKAVLLDTSDISYEYHDFIISGATLIIINTNKPRALVESKYNERRSECELALSILNKEARLDRKHLCDYSVNELEKYKNKLSEVLYRRSRHVISENERVKKAIIALNNHDLSTFGKLLNESHLSLKDDYEVSGINLDIISLELQKSKLVYGARMTGAGFGGCAIALFNTTNMAEIDKVMEEVKKIYFEKTNLNLSYYVARSSSRTGEIK